MPPLARGAGADGGQRVAFALGLTRLGFAQGPWGLFGAWLLIGVAMGSGLYEAAFAALVQLYCSDSRGTLEIIKEPD